MKVNPTEGHKDENDIARSNRRFALRPARRTKALLGSRSLASRTVEQELTEETEGFVLSRLFMSIRCYPTLAGFGNNPGKQ